MCDTYILRHCILDIHSAAIITQAINAHDDISLSVGIIVIENNNKKGCQNLRNGLKAKKNILLVVLSVADIKKANLQWSLLMDDYILGYFDFALLGLKPFYVYLMNHSVVYRRVSKEKS